MINNCVFFNLFCFANDKLTKWPQTLDLLNTSYRPNCSYINYKVMRFLFIGLLPYNFIYLGFIQQKYSKYSSLINSCNFIKNMNGKDKFCFFLLFYDFDRLIKLPA